MDQIDAIALTTTIAIEAGLAILLRKQIHDLLLTNLRLINKRIQCYRDWHAKS